MSPFAAALLQSELLPEGLDISFKALPSVLVVGMLLMVPGVLNLVGGNLPQGGLMTLIGLMVVVAGRSVGRIMARR